MKLQRQLSMAAKLSSAARDLLIFMLRKKLCVPSASAAVVAKLRELWKGLTVAGGGIFAVARRPGAADDYYFRGNYEFSCTATPVNFLATNSGGRGRQRHRRRRLRLPPCVGGRQGRETLVASVTPGWSPEPARSPEAAAAAGHEIDGRAEEFINRFYQQLRIQAAAHDEARSSSWPSQWPALCQQ